MFRDCLEFESKRRKFISKFQNRILLKCQEIFQRERADFLLSIAEERLNKKRMKISDSIKIIKCGWDWSCRSRSGWSLLSNRLNRIVIFWCSQQLAVLVLLFNLTDVQLVLLEMFYQPTTFPQALRNLRKEFGILSKGEWKAVDLTGRQALDFFVFNRFIVEE